MKDFFIKYWLVMLMGLTVVILAYWDEIESLFSKKTTAEDSTNNTPVAPGTETPASLFPLKFGSRGNEVKNLQLYINRVKNNYAKLNPSSNINTIANLNIDGIWGNKTQQLTELLLSKTAPNGLLSESKYNEILEVLKLWKINSY